MQRIRQRVAVAFLGFAVGIGAWGLVRLIPARPTAIASVGPVKLAKPSEPRKTELQPKELAESFVDSEQLAYNGYVVSRLYKQIKSDLSGGTFAPEPNSYAVITKNNRQVAGFDPGIYDPMGNSTSFGLFPFLGGATKQLVLSQDVARGGTQSVFKLFPRCKIIFDGAAWGVGRERGDMQAFDFDDDGVYEITVPITDFYALQDKMSIAEVPLPIVIFRYDRKTEKYFPANNMFPEHTGQNDSYVRYITNPDELWLKSAILNDLFVKVYAGKEGEAWTYFDRNYNDSDKQELRERIKSILKEQPVYKFIYRRSR